MKRLVRDKHSSLLRKSVNYDSKIFYSTSPRVKLKVEHLAIVSNIRIGLTGTNAEAEFVVSKGDEDKKVF
jgi:hypothetical protein